MKGAGIAGVLALGLSLGGCGTIVNLTFGVEYHEGGGGYGSAFGTSVGGLFHSRTMIYGGIRTDIHAFGKGTDGVEGFFWSVFAIVLSIIDFPLSLAGDTLTLPYTIPVDLTHESKSPPRQESPDSLK